MERDEAFIEKWQQVMSRGVRPFVIKNGAILAVVYFVALYAVQAYGGETFSQEWAKNPYYLGAVSVAFGFVMSFINFKSNQRKYQNMMQEMEKLEDNNAQE